MDKLHKLLWVICADQNEHRRKNSNENLMASLCLTIQVKFSQKRPQSGRIDRANPGKHCPYNSFEE